MKLCPVFERLLKQFEIEAALHHVSIQMQCPDVNGVCRIAVQNQGNSIPPEALPQIWDRYYRADQVGTGRPLGTGLGLAIVKSIMDWHAV